MSVELLVFLPGILMLILANYSEKKKNMRILTWIFLLLIILLLFAEGILALSPEGQDLLGATSNMSNYAYATLITSIIAGLILLKSVRVLISKVLNIDPENMLHATALVFSVLLVGTSLATALSVNIVELSGEGGIGTGSVVLQDLIFVISAFFGVGWMVRKNLRQTLKRLDLVKPSLKDLIMSLGFLVLIFALVIIVNLGVGIIDPNSPLIQDGEDPTIQLLGGVTVLTAIIFSLGAGIAEEILFRGAMQPRLGIIFTSLVFALIHIQYFDLLSMAMLFTISLIFGYEKRITNTTACIITHSLYDMVLMMLIVFGI